MEARLSEPTEAGRASIHPHLLTAAKQTLLRRRQIIEEGARTRGGREVVIYHAPIRTGDRRRIEDIAARKRLLHTRFLSWAKSSRRYPRGLIGPAGERVLYACLRAPELGGLYALANPQAGEITHLFGQPVPGGPLDAAAIHMGVQGGIPVGPITVLFEVKNVRHWMYPASEELYQLLDKAARLQQARPNDRILPVLVCRRRHFWARQLAVHLGFFIIEVHDQFVLPAADIEPAHFAEVTDELGYSTLRLHDGTSDRLIQTLRDALPRYAVETAERWAEFGSTFAEQYAVLRDPNSTTAECDAARLVLRTDREEIEEVGYDYEPDYD